MVEFDINEYKKIIIDNINNISILTKNESFDVSTVEKIKLEDVKKIRIQIYIFNTEGEESKLMKNFNYFQIRAINPLNHELPKGLNTCFPYLKINEEMLFLITGKDNLITDKIYNYPCYEESLIFRIKLIDITYKKTNKVLSSIDDYIKSINQEKELGNKLYNENKFEESIKYYIKCENIIKHIPKAILVNSTTAEIKYLQLAKLNIFNNLSINYIKLNKYKDGYNYVNKSLEIDNSLCNTKSYYRKGICLENMKDYNAAAKTFKLIGAVDKMKENLTKYDNYKKKFKYLFNVIRVNK